MLKKIRALFSSSETQPNLHAPIQAPVDLNKPVENPALLSAIDAMADEPTDSNRSKLLLALNGANLLAAILTDEMITAETAPGQTIIKAGSLIKFLTAGKDGQSYLSLFTDWNALRTYTNFNVSAMIFPSLDAWQFALQGNTYDGVVVNPAHNAVSLNRQLLQYLARGSDT